ncbi:MAG: DUF5939 domain-containing protein [Pseudomonadota bacterium]
MADAPLTETREFDLSQSPAALWPLLADTNRLNEALGLPRYALSVDREPEDPRLLGHSVDSGRSQVWEERPFEWVAGQWWRFERLFHKGPLKTLSGTLVLKRTPVGGAQVQFAISAEPDGLVGKTLLASGHLRKLANLLQERAEDVDAFLAGARPTPFSTQAPVRPREADRQIDGRASDMAKSDYSNGAAPALASMLAEAPDSELSEIRVRRLSRVLELPERETAEACLAATEAGLLQRRFIVICPRCRRPCADAPSLAELPERASCAVDAVEFGCDLALNVESVFTASPSVRALDRGFFCGSGPMTAPHVVIQQLLAPGERRVFPFTASTGGFRLRADPPIARPGEEDLGAEAVFDHQGGAFPMLAASGDAVAVGAPSPDGSIVFENHSTEPRLMRLERREWRADALTAAEISVLQAYRDMFPSDGPAQAVRSGRLVFLHVAPAGQAAVAAQLGDERPIRALAAAASVAKVVARRRNGGIVRRLGDALTLVFLDPLDAVAAALELRAEVINILNAAGAQQAGGLTSLSFGVAAGRTVATRSDAGIDFVGQGATLAMALSHAGQPHGVHIASDLANAPGVPEAVSRFQKKEGALSLHGASEPYPFLHVAA